MRAIWATWETGEKLDFRGEFYTHTLMTPFFDPGKNPYGNPKILLAAVGELMTEVAGEVGDGLLVHGFSTERYLREVTLPALEAGAAKAGKSRADLTVSYPGFVVTGANDEDVERATKAVREQIAFYGSTPAYRSVLELHGWGDLQTELNTLSKRGEWVKMGELIDDDVLDAFAVVAPIEQVAAQVQGALRRHRRPLQLLRPLQDRPRDLAGHAGGVPLTARGPRAATAGRPRGGPLRLDDDVDQAGRPGDHSLRLSAGQRLGHLGRGQRDRDRLGLDDRPDLPRPCRAASR